MYKDTYYLKIIINSINFYFNRNYCNISLFGMEKSIRTNRFSPVFLADMFKIVRVML